MLVLTVLSTGRMANTDRVETSTTLVHSHSVRTKETGIKIG